MFQENVISSYFGRPTSSTISVFKQADRSFFAQGHVKRIRFSVRDFPLRFISFYLIFSAHFGRILPMFA